MGAIAKCYLFYLVKVILRTLEYIINTTVHHMNRKEVEHRETSKYDRFL